MIGLYWISLYSKPQREGREYSIRSREERAENADGHDVGVTILYIKGPAARNHHKSKFRSVNRECGTAAPLYNRFHN